jgi:hypothetical protein
MAKAEAEALETQAKDAESTASRKRLNQTAQTFGIAQRAIEKHRDISDIGHQRSMDEFMDASRELSNLMPAKVAELLDVVSTILNVNDQAKPLPKATGIVLTLRRLAAPHDDIPAEGEPMVTISDDELANIDLEVSESEDEGCGTDGNDRDDDGIEDVVD